MSHRRIKHALTPVTAICALVLAACGHSTRQRDVVHPDRGQDFTAVIDTTQRTTPPSERLRTDVKVTIHNPADHAIKVVTGASVVRANSPDEIMLPCAVSGSDPNRINGSSSLTVPAATTRTLKFSANCANLAGGRPTLYVTVQSGKRVIQKFIGLG